MLVQVLCPNKNKQFFVVVVVVFTNFSRLFHGTMKDEQGLCEYRIPKNVTNVYNVFREFGVSAAHPTLPADTLVEVSVGQETALVTINADRQSKTGVLLELSPEAAAELSITREGLVPCTVHVPIFENHPHLKDFVVYASCVGLIMIYYLFNYFF